MISWVVVTMVDRGHVGLNILGKKAGGNTVRRILDDQRLNVTRNDTALTISAMATSASSPPSPSPPPVLHGHCYCGGVTFYIPFDVQPHTSTYCHCESCRRAHSSPLYQVIYIKPEEFTITSGKELISDFCKPSSSCQRSFCSQCGSRILNRIEGRPDWLGFFPSLLADETQHNLPANLAPKGHYLSEEAVLDLVKLDDGLPRT